jgi:hypothetical protein
LLKAHLDNPTVAQGIRYEIVGGVTVHWSAVKGVRAKGTLK